MNIFATYECYQMSARYLDNKRVVKMILESTQLLSTAIFLNNGNNPYLPNHIKHPCTIWTAKTKSNFLWLLDHLFYLNKEYEYRYENKHKCFELFDILHKEMNCIPNGPLTTFANCTRNIKQNIDFRNIEDVHLAYRMYLHARWEFDKITPYCSISMKQS